MNAWRSVRARTTVLALVVVLGALLIAEVGLVTTQRRTLTASLADSLEQWNDSVAEAIGDGDPFENLLISPVDDGTIRIEDASGRVIAEGGDDDDRPDGGVQQVRSEVEDPGGDPLVIITFAPEDNIDESVAALISGLVIGTPLLLAILGWALWVVIGRALHPVEAIRRQAERIGADQLDERVPTTGAGDEVDRLAITMNAMLARLEAASAQQRAFVADASHELRTPLTGIIAQLDSLGPVAPNEAQSEVRAVTLREAQRMHRLVEDLLVLARTGQAAGSERRGGLVDLDDVVLEELRGNASTGPAIDARQVSGGQVRGNADELRRIVRNLVDNARRAARSGIEVSVQEQAGSVVLTVADDGPGVAPADRERIFDRFVRLDDARARADGGSGLGLAIARDLVAAHGGTISIGTSAQGGAEFQVVLPAASGVDP